MEFPNGLVGNVFVVDGRAPEARHTASRLRQDAVDVAARMRGQRAL